MIHSVAMDDMNAFPVIWTISVSFTITPALCNTQALPVQANRGQHISFSFFSFLFIDVTCKNTLLFHQLQNISLFLFFPLF